MNDTTLQPRAFSRTDQSFLGAWWWTIDKVTLYALIFLIVVGTALVASASPSVAQTIGVSDFHFLMKHIIIVIPSFILLVCISMLSPRSIWRGGTLLFLGTVCLLVLVLLVGTEVKGARRWINIFGFSLQPSEILKPAFAVLSAWLIALHKKSTEQQNNKPDFKGWHITIMLYLLMIMLLLQQPDFGMSAMLTLVFATQIFIAGLRFRYLAGLAVAGVACVGAAYASLDHVRSRIDRFFNPESGDTFQVDKSLDAIRSGGVVGVGPGQGVEKTDLPDAHADFIFSVLVEETGLLFSTVIVGIFLFIIIRGFKRLQDTQDLFSILAAGGLLAMFGFQSLIHIGSAINILPAKGMTLPFLSYGGSSLLSMAISFGVILALTRQRMRESIARTSINMRRSKGEAHV